MLHADGFPDVSVRQDGPRQVGPAQVSGAWKKRHKRGAGGARILGNCAGAGKGGRRRERWPLNVASLSLGEGG